MGWDEGKEEQTEIEQKSVFWVGDCGGDQDDVILVDIFRKCQLSVSQLTLTCKQIHSHIVSLPWRFLLLLCLQYCLISFMQINAHQKCIRIM